jgi:hypothetical protein
MATEQQKRRAREAARRAAEVDAKHQHEIVAAKSQAFGEGHAAGAKHGAKVMRDTVLDHAGRLYKEGKDDAAKAVRDVQRLLPTQ